MLGLISLSFFAQSGHIDAFRSIVGEAPEAGIEPDGGESNPARFQGLVQSECDGCVMATRPAHRG